MTTKDHFEIIFLVINSLILLITVIVIRKSPIDAVKIGRILNDQQNKDNAKRNLFLTLFSFRGIPVHPDFVNALNKIEIVFNDTPVVLEAWHKLYDSYNNTSLVDQETTWRLIRFELLSKISLSLGYTDLKQYDMEKNYFPQGHANQHISEFEFRNDQQAYYKSAGILNKFLINYYSTCNSITDIDANHPKNK